MYTAMQYAVSTSKPSNKRADNRLDICLQVEVTYPDGQKFKLCTRNMSTTGLFLETGNRPVPEVGKLIQVQVSSELGMPDAPLVKAEVIRVTDEGFGIMFLHEE